jgi:L-ribulose-5-phosphate 3-epimerase
VSLRYGFVTNGLASHRLDDALLLLGECGYDGVALTLDHAHFDPFAPDVGERAARLRRRLEELGLAAVIETGGRFALDHRRKHHPSLLSDGRERRVDYVRRAIDIAAEVGAPVVSMWSGAVPEDVGRELAWKRLLDGMRPLLAHAEERGIVLGFEPEPGMLVERLDEFEALAEALDSPGALGLTLDLGHCVCIEPEPVAACVRRGAGKLVHVHADDMCRGVHEHLMFGDGDLDVEAALGALAAVGYRGLVAVELSRDAHRAHETVPQAIALLRSHERERLAL